MIGTRAYLYVVALLISGFYFLALPEEGFSGFATIEEGCCMIQEGCIDAADSPPNAVCISDNFVEDAFCNEEIGECIPIPSTSNIPTLSEWGVIAIAGALGIIGIWAVRKRKLIV